MKKLLLIFTFLAFCSITNAQPYGNEWITNYDKQFWRIFVVKDGIYRLDSATLATAGVPSTDPSKFQIFGRGEQQYIYVKNTSISSILDGDDYIEFYGMHNDGWYDSSLYVEPSAQMNTNYSMFNDTAIYFLSSSISVADPVRRMTSETDIGSYTALPYFYKISRADFTDRYSAGDTHSNDVTDPEYTADEGWFSTWFSRGQSFSPINIATANVYGTENAQISFGTVGCSDYGSLWIDHHLNVSLGSTVLADTTFEGYYSFKKTSSVSNSLLGSSTTAITIRSIDDLGSSGNNDYNAVSFVSIRYPHTLNLEGDSSFLLQVPYLSGGSAKVKLSFSNFVVHSSDSVRFYDLTNHKRIRVSKNSSNYDVVLPNGVGEKKCYITSEGQIKKVSYIEPVNSSTSNFAKFTDYTDPSILRSDYLIVSHQSLWSEAEDYRDYRSSAAGGNYSVLLVDVNELYDVFCYGIRKNPLAIRNFAYYANDNFFDQPKDLFLLGKGYRAAVVGNNTWECYRKNPSYYSSTLIPGFGIPASDILFVARDTSLRPLIPVGRLAARNGQQAEWYLNKVMDYEEAQANAQTAAFIDDYDWMKNVLHFGGGSNQSQQTQLRNFLTVYENIIEDTLFGAYVRTFLKSSTAPIQINTADSLHQLIDGGVSMMTFFGHGAGIGFDYSIDYPSNYNNYQKYPFLLALSCLAGDLYDETPTSSEEFVLIENKGTIAYLASVTRADQAWLHQYSKLFHEQIGQYNYGKPVGIAIQNTIDSLYTDYYGYFSAKSVCLEMTLHGDPAIKLNSFDKPDYEISENDVYFTPNEVTTLDSTFTINLIATNQGRAIDTSFIVNVHREFPDGSFVDSSRMVTAPHFRDTITFTLPVDITRGVGLNKFTVWLDFLNGISEISETNNYTTVSMYIKSNDITPVYPYEYAIIPSLNVTLKASTGDPFSPLMVYRFELDTTDAFKSPVLTTQTINHSGGVVPWNVVFPVTTDSIVYYWRCSVDSATYGNYSWRESSFQFIPGKRGWGQAHFFQYKKDNYEYVTYNKPQRKFEFINNLRSIFAQTGYYSGDAFYPWTEEKYTLDGSLMSYANCVMYQSYWGDAIKIAVFDPISGDPWYTNSLGYMYLNPQGYFDCHDLYDSPAFDFQISSDTNLMEKIADFIDSIPPNYYVLALSHRNHHSQEWTNHLINAFKSIGSSVDIGSPLTNNAPYIIFGYKGAPAGGVNETQGVPYGYLVPLYDTIQTKWNEGNIQSTIVGPAASWDSLFWRVESIDPLIYDQVKLNVIGIKMDGTSQLLIHDLPPIPDSLDMSIHDRIDSSIYPYLKLEAVLEDDTFNTPFQMVRWQVTYEPMPETALDPSISFSFVSDTIDEGDSIHFSCATHNISEFDMDSLLIRYWVIDADRNVAREKYVRYEEHPAGDTLYGSVSFSTDSLAGINEFWVEVNPNNDQAEQYHFNNIGSITFHTNADRINPLLDVTFDGVHIMDGDIVSAKPMIEIRLKDENKFLLLNEIEDTSLFKVFIQAPDELTATPVYFKQTSTGEEIMQFFPAPSSADNKCRIEYNAEFPEDGTYKLIVQAKDKSRNNSGNYDYEVEFEVINKSTITQVMNWPNPFSTATHFVFTLTGSELPSYFEIQIMTITGKVVREINMDELGSLHIGRNITTYAWDGKDEYGDQLANGVYLYRVVTHINGKIIEKMETEADKYFKQEFGKMYLMR